MCSSLQQDEARKMTTVQAHIKDILIVYILGYETIVTWTIWYIVLILYITNSDIQHSGNRLQNGAAFTHLLKLVSSNLAQSFILNSECENMICIYIILDTFNSHKQTVSPE